MNILKGLLFPEFAEEREEKVHKAIKIMEDELRKGPIKVSNMELEKTGRKQKGVEVDAN